MRCAVKCTIKDVAKAAGVSPSTVSRALHNNPRISEQARERIRTLAKEMGFHPNQMARSLVNRRTRVIGIVFPANLAESLGHPFYPQVLQGLGQTAAERRHYVLLGTGQGGETTPEAIRQLVDSGYVSGLVLLAADAAPNTVRRAAHFGEAGRVLWLDIPFSKGELGACVGRTSCGPGRPPQSISSAGDTGALPCWAMTSNIW